jgi:tetratricopeptide (TPR) repeat protein
MTKLCAFALFLYFSVKNDIMNPKIVFVSIAFTLLSGAGFRYALHTSSSAFISTTASKQRLVMQCSPNWSFVNEDSLAKKIGVLPGWGNYRWNIDAANDSARFYFNQGINMYYAFHIIEAMASFKKAALFDDNNAMINWGIALAYGPNINDFAYAATPEAFAAAQKALSLKNNCTAAEKVLIDAIAVRYSADSTVSRASLNQLYAAAMKKGYQQFSSHADIATLYADALMLQHPWDYWKHNGEAEPWTPELLAVLESVIKLQPNHPGANHYYIHSVEASFNSKRAMASADRLGTLMPGVAHMIHMPSHIYIRNGKYKEGITVNEMSVTGYNNYLNLFPEVQNNIPLYLIHNLHMQSNCAMMRADYNYSNTTALACRNSFDTSFLGFPAPLGTFIQYVYMTPVINDVRFGKWDAILNAPPVSSPHQYAMVLWHWARGMAFAGKNELTAAAGELEIMQEKMKGADMPVVMEPFNSPLAAAKVAEKILAGVIAEQQKQFTTALSLLSEAVALEDRLIYNEPRDWLLPAREYLGNALLHSGNAAKAEIIFKEDLKENPATHWSLYPLRQALLLQNKKAEAAQIKSAFDQAFEGADITAGAIAF